jgi:2-phosphosulfolactate phosphatase
MLDVRIQSLLEGAEKAEGIAVLVDIFRMGTNVSLMLDKGAKKIIPIANLNESLALVHSHPEYIFVGERDGTKVPKFDYGNSPSEIDSGDCYGKVVTINTTSGTQGIVRMKDADQILIGGFANSPAIEKYIKEAERFYDGRNPVIVSIIPMGWAGIKKAYEDEAYAEYLKGRLLGTDPVFEEVKNAVLGAEFTKRFFDPNDKDFPKEDLEYCLQLGRFYNVPKVYKIGEGVEIRDANFYNPGTS